MGSWGHPLRGVVLARLDWAGKSQGCMKIKIYFVPSSSCPHPRGQGPLTVWLSSWFHFGREYPGAVLKSLRLQCFQAGMGRGPGVMWVPASPGATNSHRLVLSLFCVPDTHGRLGRPGGQGSSSGDSHPPCFPGRSLCLSPLYPDALAGLCLPVTRGYGLGHL